MPVGDGQELDFSFGDPLADVDFSDGAKVIDWANTRLSENNNFFGDWGDKAAQLLGATMGGPINSPAPLLLVEERARRRRRAPAHHRHHAQSQAERSPDGRAGSDSTPRRTHRRR